jgi:D-threo-aldose 1-dehydrogenase
VPDADGATSPVALGPLGLGCADLGNLHQAMSDEQADAVLTAAWDGGVRYFDTAPHYGLGLSERRLGAFLRTRPREEYAVSTKVGRLLEPSPGTASRTDEDNDFVVPASLRRVWDVSPEGVRRSLDASLERLGLDRVDVLYLHDPEEHDLDLALHSAVPALVDLRDQGVVRAVGVGSKSTPALLAAVRTGALDLLMVAGRLTVLDRSALAEVVPECDARGVGVVAASVYNSGLLASPDPGPGGRYEYAQVPADVLERARRLEQVCRRHGVELPAAAVQFPLQEPVVRCVVAGAADPAQVQQNLARVRAALPDALWADLRAAG